MSGSTNIGPNKLKIVAGVFGTIIMFAGTPSFADEPTVARPATDGQAIKNPAEEYAEQLRAARRAVKANPADAQLHFQLAELLRKGGRLKEASVEYSEATAKGEGMFVAYHQLAQICDDPAILEEAVSRLDKSKDAHPKDLLLRVALSELIEKQKNYYQAAKPLIELQYANGVPPKYKARIDARVHYLLSKAKEAQLQEKDIVPTDEALDVVPAPLPENGMRKAFTAAKVKENKDLKGVGHVPLLP